MRRSVLVALALVACAAGPASAHEEINPKRVVVGQPTYLLLSAANEKTVALNGIVVTAPKGLPFGESTSAPSGWAVRRTEASVTFDGGPIAPREFQTFGFEIEGADQPGTLTYAVELRFASGETEKVSVPIEAVAADGATSAPGPTASSAAAPSSAASVTIAPAPLARGKSSDSSARLLGGAGLLAGLMALVIALARGRRGAREI
jgi:uncharacterized protein YcnI